MVSTPSSTIDPTLAADTETDSCSFNFGCRRLWHLHLCAHYLVHGLPLHKRKGPVSSVYIVLLQRGIFQVADVFGDERLGQADAGKKFTAAT
jgi:hypothetical protein